MDAAIKPPPERSTMKQQSERSAAPPDQTRSQYLDGLRSVLENLRNDPVGGQFVRRFEELSNLIKREEGGSFVGVDPLLAIRHELGRIGTWVRIQELAVALNEKDVQAPATRNFHQKATVRRPLSNPERLVRIILQGVNHGRLLGYKKDETGVTVTYVGLVGWQMPKGVSPIQARQKGRKSK